MVIKMSDNLSFPYMSSNHDSHQPPVEARRIKNTWAAAAISAAAGIGLAYLAQQLGSDSSTIQSITEYVGLSGFPILSGAASGLGSAVLTYKFS